MKFINNLFRKIKNRFDNVWVDTYPWYWHIANFIGGLICAIFFVVTQHQYSTGTKVGLFFAIAAIGYLFMLAFTYGIVRARNGWTKKKKVTSPNKKVALNIFAII
ncbi:hypothetical protein MYMA111404_02715 [Mycoplasma marinum]|uniref:Uncharacterized protein n=1 Tax=Mycoplasma marinum TaxID=1937190 RepID=A0A4R0XJM8_9MOLU|nr:hypothetical protein [Mycoplasma marinum]TCG10833.1 hypothetical protein C4B24_03835 [Mycoplasma marinum]